MKIYNKPELNVEQFDVIDILTADASNVNAETGGGDMDFSGMSAGLEFDVNVAGDEF